MNFKWIHYSRKLSNKYTLQSHKERLFLSQNSNCLYKQQQDTENLRADASLMFEREILAAEKRCIYTYEWMSNSVLCCLGQVQQLCSYDILRDQI